MGCSWLVLSFAGGVTFPLNRAFGARKCNCQGSTTRTSRGGFPAVQAAFPPRPYARPGGQLEWPAESEKKHGRRTRQASWTPCSSHFAAKPPRCAALDSARSAVRPLGANRPARRRRPFHSGACRSAFRSCTKARSPAAPRTSRELPIHRAGNYWPPVLPSQRSEVSGLRRNPHAAWGRPPIL